MSSQGLGEAPGEGDLLYVRLAEMSENVKTMAIRSKNIQDQQSKQKSSEEIQDAALQTLDSMTKVVVEAMKSPAGSDAKKMVLPFLKSMNFSDKLNNEVVSNALSFKLWMKKLEHWVSTLVNSVGMDIKLA